jgi:hypothetical protein
MPVSMTERIKELREEIAEISKQNGGFLRAGRKDAFGLGEQQRRLQRLQEIKEELMSLTAWKKL